MRIGRWLVAVTTALQGMAVVGLALVLTLRPAPDGPEAITTMNKNKDSMMQQSAGCAALLAVAAAFGAQAVGLARARLARALRWADDAVGWACVLFCCALRRDPPAAVAMKESDGLAIAVLALAGPLLCAGGELIVGTVAAAALRADALDCGKREAPDTGADVAAVLDGGSSPFGWGGLHAAALGARVGAFALVARPHNLLEEGGSRCFLWCAELAMAVAASGVHACALAETMSIAADPRRYEDVFYSSAEDTLPPGVIELWTNFSSEEEAAGVTVSLSRADRLHAVGVRYTRAHVCTTLCARAALLVFALDALLF